MGWKSAATIGVGVVLLAFSGCAGAGDVYARNPNGHDPRARVLDVRVGMAPAPDQIRDEFRKLQRPIVLRYVEYRPTVVEAMASEMPYTHIVLSDETCDFIGRYTFDELAFALHDLVDDEYWCADTLAVLSTAAWAPWSTGRALDQCGYRSPDQPGTWPNQRRRFVGGFGISRSGATWAISGSGLREKTAEELARERRDIETLRRHGLWPKNEKSNLAKPD